MKASIRSCSATDEFNVWNWVRTSTTANARYTDCSVFKSKRGNADVSPEKLEGSYRQQSCRSRSKIGVMRGAIRQVGTVALKQHRC